MTESPEPVTRDTLIADIEALLEKSRRCDDELSDDCVNCVLSSLLGSMLSRHELRIIDVVGAYSGVMAANMRALRREN